MPEEDLGRTYRTAEPRVSAGQSALTTRRFILLLLLVAASRIPFIGRGYGSDADAWRVASSAHALADEGTYRVSRFPGFPLYEILVTPAVVLGGAPYANALSTLAMLLVLVVWRPIVRDHTRRPALLILCFAFTPILWKNSATTMDYLWSLLFIMLCYALLLRRRHPVAAGMLLGIAAGFRAPNAVMVLPMVTFLAMHDRPLRNSLIFLGTAALTALAAFLPPLLSYGPAGLQALTKSTVVRLDYSLVERALFFGYRGASMLGLAATAVAVVIAARGFRTFTRAVSAHDPVILSCCAGIAAPLLLFAFYPIESEYLIPMIPFLYLLLDRVASTRQMWVFAAAVLLLAVVTPDVIRHQGVRGTPELNLHAGMLQEFEMKKSLVLEKRDALGRLEVPAPALVMTGTGPEFWIENPAFVPDTASRWRAFPEVVVHLRRQPDVHFIDAITLEEIARVRSAGYAVYCYAPAREYLETVLRYRMSDESIPLIDATE